jgi:hypothetical protein
MMKKFIALLLVALIPMFFLGCGDTKNDTTTNDSSGDTIANQSSVAFVGKVVDINGDPMPGVSVQLLADVSYSAGTDSNGNWIINVDLGRIVAVGGGGGPETTDNDIGTDPDVITRNFPIEYTRAGFGVYRQEADVDLTIGYTDGTGAVILLSKTGTVQPTVVLHPYIDNFSFYVYAGDQPADGATVLFARYGYPGEDDSEQDDTSNQGSRYGDRYEMDAKVFVADENGMIEVKAADKLPADGTYMAFGSPYDPDGDGDFEYEATVLTQPSGGFNLDVQWQDSALIHYEYDSVAGAVSITQTENAPYLLYRDASTDLQVVYCSIDNVQNLPIAEIATFKVYVMFNRPVTEQVLAAVNGPLFRLTASGLNVPITWTTTNNYWYEITPAATLTPAGNMYAFTVANGAAWAGGLNGTLFTQNFYIYNPDATYSASITPGVDINTNTTYMVDWDDILFGLPFADAGMIPTLNMSWAVDPTATGYEVWVKRSGTAWYQVNWAAPAVNYTYNDGLFIEANITLDTAGGGWGGLFDAFDSDNTFGLAATEPFFGGNVIQVIVMPQNENGFAKDPNTIAADDATFIPLTLADNRGPELQTGAGWNPADPVNGVTATVRFDAMGVPLTVDEPLGDFTLVAEYVTGQYGVRGASGYFTVTDVFWPDNDLADPDTDTAYPSNRGYLAFDMSADVATTLTAAAAAGATTLTVADVTGFAIGDELAVGTNGAWVDGLGTGDEATAYTVVGFNSAAKTLTIDTGLTSAAAVGAAVYWRGPWQAGYAAGSINEAGSTIGGFSDTLLFVTNVHGMAVGETRLTTPGGGTVGVVTDIEGAAAPATSYGTVAITTAMSAHMPAGSAVSGFSWGTAANAVDPGNIATTTVAAGAAAGSDVNLLLTSTLNIVQGDVLLIDRGDAEEERVTVKSLPAANTVLVDLVFNHAATDTVEETRNISTTLFIGFPFSSMSSAAGLAGIQPSTTLAVDDLGGNTDSAAIVQIWNQYMVINDLLYTDDATPVVSFYAGADWDNSSARVSDYAQVNLLDRSTNDSSATDDDLDGTPDWDNIGWASPTAVGITVF